MTSLLTASCPACGGAPMIESMSLLVYRCVHCLRSWTKEELVDLRPALSETDKKMRDNNGR